MNIDEFFEQIMLGNAGVLTVDNIKMLNDTALEIYNIGQLNSDQVETLKKIIMVCNVLYNRTDMTVLPIEDGFYDLLLEKYKQYDANFQVGSAVIEFRNFIENDIENPRKVARCPVIFNEPVERNEIHLQVYNEIMRYGKQLATRRDFEVQSQPINQEYISKRTHSTEHNHPTLVGTLDKAKFVTNQDAIDAGAFNDANVKILERDFFQDHINKGIIFPNQEIEVVVELKYDGISVEADCLNTVLSARTRGDTGIGVASDITPILQGYTFKNYPDDLHIDPPLGIKFEAIMTKGNLEIFNRMRGRSYANCRSAIVGLFGASDAYLYRDMITLVPLALDREQFAMPIDNRLEEIEFLNRLFSSHGEPLRYCYFKGTISEVLYLIKVFWDEAKIARDYLDFMYDGIVVSYLDENIRAELGRKNYINKYSMAVKFDPLEKQTIFRGYTFEIGQHGNITPMIHYDPVEFLGTIHTKSTGSSLERFNNLALKYGDFINVKYVNDVMPYVSKVECEHNRNNSNPVFPMIDTCPVCKSKLVVSDSGKSLICPNMECPARTLQRMVNMFAKLNIKGFADATFMAIPELDHLYKLIHVDNPIEFYKSRLGEADGIGFVNALNWLTTEPQKDYILVGALGFTSMAYKKWQSILQQVTLKEIYDMYVGSNSDLNLFRHLLSAKIPNNLGIVTLETIVNQFQFFVKDIEEILTWSNVQQSLGSDAFIKGQIRFSGFRNQQLVEQLTNAGYDADDNASVTRKTDILLIPNAGFSSTKVIKAMKNPNTKIIPIQEFNVEEFIGL